jgi:hypothetical protein
MCEFSHQKDWTNMNVSQKDHRTIPPRLPKHVVGPPQAFQRHELLRAPLILPHVLHQLRLLVCPGVEVIAREALLSAAGVVVHLSPRGREGATHGGRTRGSIRLRPRGAHTWEYQAPSPSLAAGVDIEERAHPHCIAVSLQQLLLGGLGHRKHAHTHTHTITPPLAVPAGGGTHADWH